MDTVKGKDIGDAWLNACRYITKNGNWQKDEYGNRTKECIGLSITVEKPKVQGKIVKKHADHSMISFMKNNFLNTQPIPNWGYSYGQRIFNHNGINQFENVVKKLLNKPESRSATINLMDPKGDKCHVPCACVLDFKIRKNRLVMSAFFRSQDIGKKFYADAICCNEIMKRVSEKTGKKVGSLTISISSAHIYNRDMKDVQKLLSCSLSKTKRRW